MASGLSLEILDLRHLPGPMMRPVLEAESQLWRQRLNWDYLASAKLLLKYLDSRSLPGYVALDSGKVAGYIFCVYEDAKAVIGDVFAFPHGLPVSDDSTSLQLTTNDACVGRDIEQSLLERLIELLLHSPGVDRIESQLLLHPDGEHSETFRRAGFEVYRRLYMRLRLADLPEERGFEIPAGLELRPWRDKDLVPAGNLIAESYREHPDSNINDQYRSAAGSQRFLQNIVRFPGCGAFFPEASHVILDTTSREFVALLLGSRVSSDCGHITQVCVHPGYRGRGLARMLLQLAAAKFRDQSMSELSLTVTEANTRAVELYRRQGYEICHIFNAAVWNRF